MAHETNHDAQAALHALLEGGRGLWPAGVEGRRASPGRRVGEPSVRGQDEIVEEARKRLARRAAG